MRDNIMDFEPEELDTLLDGIDEKKLSRAKNKRIMERLDAKTGLETAGKRRQAPRLSKRGWLAIAACAVLVIGMTFGGYAIAAEAKEYNAAIEYFEANGLSTEGLSRAEIKAVYRDITTESFTCSKTAEVLSHSRETNNFEGWEIMLGDNPITSDFISVYLSETEKELDAREYQCFVINESEGGVWKEVNRKKVWEFSSPELYSCSTAVSVKGGTAAFGQRLIKSDKGSIVLPAVFKLNDDGELLWMTKWGDDQEYDSSDMIEYDSNNLVPEQDGGVTAFSVKRNYAKYEIAICVTRFDANGNIVFNVENPVGNYWIKEVYKCEDGYIALPSIITKDNIDHESSVMKFDEHGVLTGEFSFDVDSMNVKIKDIKLIGEKLYVSATVTDPEKLHKLIGQDTEVKAEDIYTAMLFACDSEAGTLHEFYQVNGAEASLFMEGNELVWNVKKIASLQFFPEDENLLCEMRGTADVWRFSFDDACKLIDSTSTGEFATIHNLFSPISRP